MDFLTSFFSSVSYSLNYKTLTDTGIAVAVLLIFVLLRKLFTKYVFHTIFKTSRDSQTEFFSHLRPSLEHPIRWLFIIMGIYVSAGFFPFIEQTNPVFIKLIRASIIVMITWGIYNLSSGTSELFIKINEHLNIEIDRILIPFLSKLVRFIVLAISLIIIVEEFGYDVNGFVAGLGLGGLAFALAAKDALSNLFGGFVIITEKPFSIGDWIMTSSAEGIVEDISFRSTKVRTFAQALVTVPNATLSNETITNWSKMGKRRITFYLGVTYDTPRKKLERTIEKIEHLLRNHADIHQETIFVTFDRYDDSSLGIFLYFFTKTTVWEEYLKVKQEINFKIMEILEDEGVSVAFPSRTLYINTQSQEGSQADVSLERNF